jgi:hypothetical protein
MPSRAEQNNLIDTVSTIIILDFVKKLSAINYLDNCRKFLFGFYKYFLNHESLIWKIARFAAKTG